MGWRDLFGRVRARPRVGDDLALVIGDPAIANRLQRPREPVWNEGPQEPCERCGGALEERVITSALPSDQPDDWDRAPVAVDGWACERCGVLRYPRNMEPAQITSFGERGVELARAGRPKEAEWWFTRITWDWPGWPPGYMDLAQALQERIARAPEAPRVPQLRARARESYVAAVHATSRDPEAGSIRLVALAHLGLANIAIDELAIERARRALEACLALGELDPDVAARAVEIQRCLDEERYVFSEAMRVVLPYMHFSDRPPRSFESVEARERVAEAVATLEAYGAAHPAHWQSKWAAAMGLAALGEHERALEAWRSTWRAHPDQADVVREYGRALLRRDRVDEALEVNRDATARLPLDATLWCNRAVCEVLAGDLREARRAVAESRRLDPNDAIARALEARLATMRGGGPLPRTLAELEGRRG